MKFSKLIMTGLLGGTVVTFATFVYVMYQLLQLV